MLNEKQKFNTIMRLGVEFAEVKDVDVLLERILREAVRSRLMRVQSILGKASN